MPIRFQVDPDFYDHPKAIGMSDAATALWVRAGSYSAAKLSDGFIAEHVLSLLTRCPEEAAGELVMRGLWRRVKGGYRFHQWSPRNLTRARVEADKTADRLRKQSERRIAGQNKKPQVEQPIVQPDSIPDSERNPDGIRPLSVSVSLSESVSGSGHEPRPPNRCPEHRNKPTDAACGRCREARLAGEAWDAAKRARLAGAAKCRVHRGELAHNCRLCRAEELNPA